MIEFPSNGLFVAVRYLRSFPPLPLFLFFLALPLLSLLSASPSPPLPFARDVLLTSGPLSYLFFRACTAPDFRSFLDLFLLSFRALFSALFLSSPSDPPGLCEGRISPCSKNCFIQHRHPPLRALSSFFLLPFPTTPPPLLFYSLRSAGLIAIASLSNSRRGMLLVCQT